jgi:hypothetical protein
MQAMVKLPAVVCACAPPAYAIAARTGGYETLDSGTAVRLIAIALIDSADPPGECAMLGVCLVCTALPGQAQRQHHPNTRPQPHSPCLQPTIQQPARW